MICKLHGKPYYITRVCENLSFYGFPYPFSEYMQPSSHSRLIILQPIPSSNFPKPLPYLVFRFSPPPSPPNSQRYIVSTQLRNHGFPPPLHLHNLQVRLLVSPPPPLPISPHPHYRQHQAHTTRTLDPIFALAIGASAALVRIRREELETGRSGAVADIMGTFGR